MRWSTEALSSGPSQGRPMASWEMHPCRGRCTPSCLGRASRCGSCGIGIYLESRQAAPCQSAHAVEHGSAQLPAPAKDVPIASCQCIHAEGDARLSCLGRASNVGTCGKGFTWRADRLRVARALTRWTTEALTPRPRHSLRVIRWHDAHGWRCAFSPCLHCAVTTSVGDWHQTEIVRTSHLSQPLARVIRWHDAHGWRCAFSPCLHCAVTTLEECWDQTEIVEHHIFPSHWRMPYAGVYTWQALHLLFLPYIGLTHQKKSLKYAYSSNACKCHTNLKFHIALRNVTLTRLCNSHIGMHICLSMTYSLPCYGKL